MNFSANTRASSSTLSRYPERQAHSESIKYTVALRSPDLAAIRPRETQNDWQHEPISITQTETIAKRESEGLIEGNGGV